LNDFPQVAPRQPSLMISFHTSMERPAVGSYQSKRTLQEPDVLSMRGNNSQYYLPGIDYKNKAPGLLPPISDFLRTIENFVPRDRPKLPYRMPLPHNPIPSHLMSADVKNWPAPESGRDLNGYAFSRFHTSAER